MIQEQLKMIIEFPSCPSICAATKVEASRDFSPAVLGADAVEICVFRGRREKLSLSLGW